MDTKRLSARLYAQALTPLVIALLAGVAAAPARGQDWDTLPSPGLEGPFNGAGPDRDPTTKADNFNGTDNSPDLRGPDGIPGTADDHRLFRWGSSARVIGVSGGRARRAYTRTPTHRKPIFPAPHFPHDVPARFPGGRGCCRCAVGRCRCFAGFCTRSGRTCIRS